jgi:hypothetical protein
MIAPPVALAARYMLTVWLNVEHLLDKVLDKGAHQLAGESATAAGNRVGKVAVLLSSEAVENMQSSRAQQSVLHHGDDSVEEDVLCTLDVVEHGAIGHVNEFFSERGTRCPRSG